MPEPMSVALPPGLFGNGTPYSAVGRYGDGDLVRFVNGFPRPIGGWQVRRDPADTPLPPLFADPATEAARTSISWLDNLGVRHLVVGTNKGLYHIAASGAAEVITPAGLTPGSKDSNLVVGYGTGRYGRGTYGTPRLTGQSLKPAASWNFTLFGEMLIAQFRDSGPLYKWEPGDAAASHIAAAPTDAQGVLVTPERIVMTIKRQPRLVEWSASEDPDQWTPTLTNTAGSQVLAGQGELQAIVQVGRDILILSTEDAWVGRYIGAPFIYGFEPLGVNCGCLAANSVAIVAGRAFWFGPGGLWVYDGGVQKLKTDIDDWFSTVVAPTQISKMYAVEQPTFREVWWFFQSSLGTDCDRYAIFNVAEGHWAWGRLERSAGVPPIAGQPLTLIGTDGRLYLHDLAGVVVPSPHVAFIETGPLELGQGGRQMAVQFFYPDLTPENFGSPLAPQAPPDGGAQLLIIGQDYPSPLEQERIYGPYPLNRPVPTTGARGREIRLRYVGLTARWAVGRNRIVAVPMGNR